MSNVLHVVIRYADAYQPTREDFLVSLSPWYKSGSAGHRMIKWIELIQEK